MFVTENLNFQEQKFSKEKNEYLQKLFVVGQNGSIQCTNRSLQKHFKNLYDKYGKSQKVHSWQTFFSECMYWCSLAVFKFEIKDESNWKSIIDGKDKKNIGKLITNIKKTVKHKVYQFVANEDVMFTRGEVENKKSQHILLKLNLTSLDSMTVGNDGKPVSLMDIVDNSKNLYSKHYGYCWNFFIKWFLENKHRILTKTQITFLDNLTKCFHTKEDKYTVDDCYEVTGTPSSKKNTKLKKIEARVLKCWEKENPMGKKTLLQMQKEEELMLWEGLMKIVYSEDVDTWQQNKLVSDWFVKNLDEEAVWKLVFDLLPASECKEVVNAYRCLQPTISNKILYKLFEAVEKRIDELLSYEVQSVAFFKRESEVGRWDLDAHRRYEKYLQDFKNQDCRVYDRHGKLIRIEALSPSKCVNVVEVLPTGIEVLSKIS